MDILTNHLTVMKTNNSPVTIREIKSDETGILEEMLYQSVYQADISNPIPRDVVHVPRVRAYIEGFGTQKDDHCLVAESDGQIIGAAWVRVLAGEIKGYGYIDERTPEFVISLFKPHRKRGIGTTLMKSMISLLTRRGYAQTSLSVEKGNYAVKLYEKLGFRIIRETRADYIMLLKLT